jgi:tRNA (cytidine/uridine-2'-O-)-methyltransferase
LHLVGKLGFELTEKRVRRAGLDYWSDLELVRHSSWETWWQQVFDPDRVFFFSTKAQKSLYQAEFKAGDWLVFGRETKGLDASVLEQYPDQAYKIPFPGPIRSFNLSNAVAMVLGEGLRQTIR